MQIADVLDRVMGAGLQIALARHLEVEPAVAGQQIEHVVKEADAGLALAGARAVEREARPGCRSRRWCGSISPVRVEVAVIPAHCPGCVPPSTGRGARTPRPGPPERRGGRASGGGV